MPRRTWRIVAKVVDLADYESALYTEQQMLDRVKLILERDAHLIVETLKVEPY